MANFSIHFDVPHVYSLPLPLGEVAERSEDEEGKLCIYVLPLLPYWLANNNLLEFISNKSYKNLLGIIICSFIAFQAAIYNFQG